MPAPSGGLFSGIGASQTSQPSGSGGLFSGLGQSTTNSTQQPSGLFASSGLFPPPKPSTTQPPNTGSGLFGDGQPGRASGDPNANYSIFSQIPASQPDRGPNTLGQSQSRDPAHFSSLLERQKKKPRFTNGNQTGRLSQLPSLNADLGDLARRAQEIGGRSQNSASTNGADSRAHYLLAGSGVAPGKAYKDLQALDRDGAGTDYRPAEPFDPDNEKYIRNLQQRGREAMIRESMDRVNAEFDAFLRENLNINFDEQKQRIMEHFGLLTRSDDGDGSSSPGPGTGSFGKSSRRSKTAFGDSAKASTRSVFGRSGLDKSMIGNPGMGASTMSFFGEEGNNNTASVLSKGQNERYLRDKERLFMQRVEQLNQARLKEKGYLILQEFRQVETTAGGESPRQLVDAYQALQEITGESAQAVDADGNPLVKERLYASAYQNEHMNAPRAVKLKRQILDGSRSCLEKLFFHELESLIEKNPREAQLGGRPTTINKIRAYIRVRSARRDLAPDGTELQQIGENGDYCWIIIFYLLRCGFAKEAAEYVSNDPAFQSTDKRFVSYMTSYASNPDRKLPRKLQEMINGEYHQRQKIAPEHSVDPYRMACYKIVGRCDLQRRNLEAVGQGVEDWIWLQFSLAREFDRAEELSGEIFGLEQICETVREIGQKHFQKGQTEASGGYGIYFFMQVLAGMFEEAIAFLHSYNAVSSVHFAIALAYYGLLRVSDYSVAGNELCESPSCIFPNPRLILISL
jgi:nuclear pore complex protein Nup93